MPTNTSAGQQIEHELSTLKPIMVRLYLPDGITRDLPVPKKAGRYSIIAGIMESLPWDRAELIDSDEAVIGILNSGPPGEKPIANEPRDVQLLRILKEAQGMVFTEMRDTFSRALDAYAGIIERVDGRLSSMEATYVKMIEREAKRTLDGPPPAAEEDEGDGKRSVADDLMVSVGKALIRKHLGGGEGGGEIDMGKVMEIVQQFKGATGGGSAATPEPAGGEAD